MAAFDRLIPREERRRSTFGGSSIILVVFYWLSDHREMYCCSIQSTDVDVWSRQIEEEMFAAEIDTNSTVHRQ